MPGVDVNEDKRSLEINKIEPLPVELSLQSHGEFTHLRSLAFLVKRRKGSTGCCNGKDYGASES